MGSHTSCACIPMPGNLGRSEVCRSRDPHALRSHIEQGLYLLQVVRVKAFDEPAVHFRQELASSSYRIPRVWALMGRVESQHDVLLRDPCLHQGTRETRFGTIILDPYLPVFNINL